ncbi:hypothetical protein ABEB36_008342 [Hypothenemus hampei]|uniref:Regulatory protein zeste n=1 Tax=Hypothenemus hampei TaxID=57062 RepID=A0ABD1ELJ2_HYPHA
MSCQINEKQSDNFFVEVKIIKKMDEPTSSCAKKRAPNFSGEEETRLLELVTKYKNVIESRKTDAVNNKVKAETWDLITQEFNTKNDFPRMAKNLHSYAERKVAHLNEVEEDILIQLIEKYQKDFTEKNDKIPFNIWQQICCELNDSSHVKRNIAFLKTEFERIRICGKNKLSKKKELNKTGGGRLDVEELTHNEDKLQALLGERLTGFESSFDSDSHPKKRRSQEPSTSRDDDSVNVDSMEDSTEELLKDQRTDWSKCTPAQLKTPKSSSLMSHEKDKVKESGGRKTAKDKITLWALSKVELVELQKNSFLEEHKLKLKIMEDKAKKEMEVMERESRLRIEILELQKQKISSELSA